MSAGITDSAETTREAVEALRSSLARRQRIAAELAEIDKEIAVISSRFQQTGSVPLSEAEPDVPAIATLTALAENWQQGKVERDAARVVLEDALGRVEVPNHPTESIKSTVPEILLQAVETFEDRGRLADWLLESRHVFGGRSPLALLTGTDQDREWLSTILGRIEHSVYS
ncbi:MbcA/ParS/Xre antitoxin family protein [Stratiformator vulcanicus]|uniref:Antitoxin Xre/MbcA/ParS-like toxin-binding domain-containing protein n=1 Tax=Stratiformator vulcanicus TaxID=2527980 RepID=A0A517QX75_9PLAN|nr:MbcA/ParS/Xre antitoxin family protein [Stratiformator vulcanicus]QDT36259.1 hypothetical protein Pan189_06140 [Stratiformator vulcanicus]